MPRGANDGRIDNLLYANQANDPATVNNSLWGFSSPSGSGRINYLDTFNNGLNGWSLSASGVGATNPNLRFSTGAIAGGNPESIFCPPVCAQLNPGVTSGSRSLLTRRQFLGISPRLGLEAAILHHTGSPNYRLVIDYNPVGTTASGYFGLMRFDRIAGGVWEVYTPIGGGSYQAFANQGVLSDPAIALWMQIKIICDFSTGKYVKAFIGDNVYDLSGFSMFTPAFYSAIFKGYINLEVSAESFGTGTLPGFIGYALSTKDEP